MRTFTRLAIPCMAIVAASIGAARSAGAQSSPPSGGASVLLAGSPRTDKSTDPAGAFADSIDAATRDFKATGIARTINEGNFLTFPYGHSQPTVTCARLRACVIELQPGEIVLSRIAGDLERWEIAPAPSGTDGRTTLVVVKPKDCELTTNLVLATDRRIYDLTLDSPPCRPATGRTATNPRDAYARHVRFYYPDETIAKWAQPTTPKIGSDVSQLNFNYTIKRDKHFPWQPSQVFDDGAHIYIKLPPAALHAEAPALFVIADDGSRALVNYSVLGDTYITDHVFDRGVLVSGVNGKQQTVSIERRAKK